MHKIYRPEPKIIEIASALRPDLLKMHTPTAMKTELKSNPVPIQANEQRLPNFHAFREILTQTSITQSVNIIKDKGYQEIAQEDKIIHNFIFNRLLTKS